MPYSTGTVTIQTSRAAKYQRLGQMAIRPLMLGGQHCAFDLAALFYAQYADLNLLNDLSDYLRNGYVISQPKLFGLFKPIDHEGKRGWFIRIAIGDLGDLVRYFPCPLEFVAFVRNNDDNLRVIEWDAFLKTVGKMCGYKEET